MTTPAPKCVGCNKDQSQLTTSLNVCAKCKSVLYCCRECQKSNWKSHKETCTPAGSQSSASSSRPRFSIEKPFTALKNGTWLRERPEQDVYQLMSDVFRLRREDLYKFEGEVEEGSVYAEASASSEIKNYRKFLQAVTDIDKSRKTEQRLLPHWWSPAMLSKCVRVATTDENAKVEYAVEKHDIQEFYKQDDMPMQLRMFDEALDGTKVMGQSSASMMEMKIAAEDNPSQVYSMLSVD